MNEWIYEPKESMWCFVGETQAIFIKMLWVTGQYIQTIETAEGKILMSNKGEICNLSPRLQNIPCTT